MLLTNGIRHSQDTLSLGETKVVEIVHLVGSPGRVGPGDRCAVDVRDLSLYKSLELLQESFFDY
jgi:hypothetical protein